MTREVVSDLKAQINPFPRFSSKYSRKTSSSPLDMSYIGPNNSSAPSLSYIL
jgi:hypothetical protein